MSLPEVVTAAFARAGRAAPDPERVDQIGYSADEVQLIDAEVKRRRVPDQWDRA
jgi:hypothetical protein